MQINSNYIIVGVISLIVSVSIYVAGYHDGGRSARKWQEVGAAEARKELQRDAIKQNVAQFDAVTGEWRWKTLEELYPAPAPVSAPAPVMPPQEIAPEDVHGQGNPLIPEEIPLPLPIKGNKTAKK